MDSLEPTNYDVLRRKQRQSTILYNISTTLSPTLDSLLELSLASPFASIASCKAKTRKIRYQIPSFNTARLALYCLSFLKRLKSTSSTPLYCSWKSLSWASLGRAQKDQSAPYQYPYTGGNKVINGLQKRRRAFHT